jgi:ATP-dependent Clp protease ATP-binding subunit ClpA
MGARPMARVIQEYIKKPLAEEVLFGRLKSGGHVRVVLIKDEEGREKLGFEYLDGPVKPKPDKLPEPGAGPGIKAKRRSAPRRKPKGDNKGGGDGDPPRGSVPKVPLVKA